jgi:HEAT repeat protein
MRTEKVKRICPVVVVLVLIDLCSVFGAEPQGIGELLSALEDEGTRFRALRELEDLGLDAAPAVPKLMRLLDSSDDGTRSAVADVLAAIGDDGTPAIPKLVGLLGEGELPRISTELPVRDVGVRAAFALGKMGKDAVACLVSCLTNKHSAVRSNAACALGMIGPDAAGAVTPLVACLKDPDWLVRQCAAEALGDIGSDPRQTIPALAGSLKDENFNVRRIAAEALGAIRPTTPAAVEALSRALLDKEGDVQHEAAQAIGRLGPDATSAVPSLVKMLKSREMYVEGHPGVFRPVAKTAARALGAIGPKAKNALPMILNVVRDTEGTFDVLGSSNDNHEVRAEAAVAAARIEPQSDELIRTLGRALDEDDWIRDRVAVALALIGPKAKSTVPPLARLANSKYPCALNCACAVVVIEPENSSALKTMLVNTTPESYPIGDEGWTLLRTALGKGGGSSRPAIPILIRMVENANADQANAARALADFGPPAEAAISALLDLLSNRGEDLRHVAIAALQRIASEKTEPLLAALKNPNLGVRSGVVEVLGRFPAALPRITEALDDPSARVRFAALLSLANLEGSAKPTIPQIRRLLQSDSRTIRKAAAFALQRIEQGGTGR